MAVVIELRREEWMLSYDVTFFSLYDISDFSRDCGGLIRLAFKENV